MLKQDLAALAVCLVVTVGVQSQTSTAQPTPPNPATQSRQGTQASPEALEANKLSQRVVELHRQGNYDEAIQLATRALELAEKAYGPGHSFTGSVMANLAALYLGKKQLDRAEAMYERILAVRAQSPGPLAPFEVSALEAYACVLAVKAGGRADKEISKKLERLNNVSKLDSILAQGVTLPLSSDEMSGGKAISKPAPRYPDEAKARRVSGSVVMRLEVDETGRVANVKALDCTPEVLRKAAEDAVRKATFEPLVVRGKPVRVSGFITYNFNLVR